MYEVVEYDALVFRFTMQQLWSVYLAGAVTCHVGRVSFSSGVGRRRIEVSQ